MPMNNDDPILISKPGDTSLKGITTEGGWQYTRSGWMEMLKDAHAVLQQDRNNQEARQVIAEFNNAFRDAGQTQESHPLSGVGDALKGIVDWTTQDLPAAIGGLLTPEGAAATVGQATGLGNIGGVINTDPNSPSNQRAVESPWGRGGGGIPGYFGSPTGPAGSQEFREADIAEKLSRIVQATPANIGYQPMRKLWEGTGALDVMHGGELPDDRQGTYETTKDVINAGLLAATPEIGRVPGAVVRGAKAVARAPGAIARGVKSVGQRAKALYDMPVTVQNKMRATTAVDQARVATEASRAAYNQARTEAVTIKNQGGTPAQQAKANLQVVQAKLKVQQAEAQLKAQEQAFTQGGRKGEIIEQSIERGPAQTEGVELSNTLKRLKIEAMQNKGKAGPIGDDLGGLLDDLPPQEPPPAPRPKNPRPPPMPKPPAPTKMPATSKPAAATTSVEVPKGSPAAKPKVTPKAKPKAKTLTEVQLERSAADNATRRGPKEPVAPKGAEPKTPPPDVTPALEQVVQNVQRTVEPPKTKTGEFEYPPFDDRLNISQKGKWPTEPAAAIQNYLEQIKQNLDVGTGTALERASLSRGKGRYDPGDQSPIAPAIADAGRMGEYAWSKSPMNDQVYITGGGKHIGVVKDPAEAVSIIKSLMERK